MHPFIAIAHAEDQCRFCPCGASPESARGLCRKCCARMTWRRHNARPRRRFARRRFGRRARDRARILSDTTMFDPTGTEARL
jgi:hypothetical protein